MDYLYTDMRCSYLEVGLLSHWDLSHHEFAPCFPCFHARKTWSSDWNAGVGPVRSLNQCGTRKRHNASEADLGTWDALMGLKMGHTNGYFSYFFIGSMIRIRWIWHTNGYFDLFWDPNLSGQLRKSLLRNFKQPEREWFALVASSHSQYNFWEMKHPICIVHWYSWCDLTLTGHELIWHYITFALLHIIYSYITWHLL